jgi:hypothetical protein
VGKKRSAKASRPKGTSSSDMTFKADFERRPVPDGVSPSDAFGVYALSIFLNESDLSTLMADALTGGNDDKKADFIYIEPESERAFIGQSYLANQWGKPAAKANKAASLATSVTWLVSAPIGKVPIDLRQHAEDLRKAIADGIVTKLYLIFAHNCHESKNVREELDAAASSARPQCGTTVTVFAQELGFETLGRLFEAMDKDILVTDTVAFEIKGDAYEVEGPNWKAIATRIDGAAFHDLYNEHKDSLFSANIRSYLGVLRKKKGNINADIRNTVTAQPENFWVFNNGITVLTNSYKRVGKKLTVKGVSVINGAQTTGVLGECLRAEASKTSVPCRFIKCGDPSTIENIIAFNNTQNAVKSFDWRSNDRTQKALSVEFGNVGISFIYRRSQSRRAPSNSIHVETVGQGLASFHGSLQTAIRQRASIFDDDKVYGEVFPTQITAGHVYLVQCLLDAIDSIKLEFRAKKKNTDLTKLQEEYLTLLEYSTAKQFIVFVVARVADQLVGSKVEELHRWRVKPEQLCTDRANIRDAWRDVLLAVLPKIARSVAGNAQEAVRSTEHATSAADLLADFLEGHGSEFGSKFKRLRNMTLCS